MIDYRKYSVETLARWANKLNGWEWAEDMPEKPEGFDDFPTVFAWNNPRSWRVNKFDCINPYIKEIEQIIGQKEFLRWHHIHNLNRTNEQFEAWWEVAYGKAHE